MIEIPYYLQADPPKMHIDQKAFSKKSKKKAWKIKKSSGLK